MMNLKNVYLIARRDYLTYVMAWGFWLGLLATPLIIAFFALMPVLIERTDAPKYYTVIDQTGAFEKSFEAYRDQTLSARIERFLQRLPDNSLERFRQARLQGATPKEALNSLDLPGMSLANFEGSFIAVPPPANSGPNLAPWLRGDRMVDGPNGPQPLHAAIIYNGQEADIEFWSEAVSDSALLNVAKSVSRWHTQDLALERLGVSRDFIEMALRDAPAVKALRLAAPTPSGQVTKGREKTRADNAPQWAASAASFALWLLIFSVVNYLLMGTIEERSNKIFDTLLTSVKLGELLSGKLLGVLAVTLTLSLVWTLLGAAAINGLDNFSPGGNQSGIGGLMLAEMLAPKFLFVVILSFVCGYLIFGSLFLALGSLCDSVQEAQTLMSPMLILMMVPLFIVIVAMQDVEMAIVGYASWVPIFTPFLLILKMPTDPDLVMISIQILMMVGVAALILYGATRIYRAGAVTGASLGDIWRNLIKLR